MSARRAGLLAVALALAFLPGCIKLEQWWTLYPDGSGRVRMRAAIAIPGLSGDKGADAPNVQRMVAEHYLFQDLEGILVRPDYQSEFVDGKVIQSGEAFFTDIQRVRERGRPIRSNTVRLDDTAWTTDPAKLKPADLTPTTGAYDPAKEEMWVTFAKTEATEKPETWRLDIRVTTPELERWVWRRMAPPLQDQPRAGVPLEAKRRPAKAAPPRKGAVPRIQLCGIASVAGDNRTPGTVWFLKLKFLDDQGKPIQMPCCVDVVTFGPPQPVALVRKTPDGGMEMMLAKNAAGGSKLKEEAKPGDPKAGDPKAPSAGPADPKADPKKDPKANPPKPGDGGGKGDNPISGEPETLELVKKLTAGFNARISIRLPGNITQTTAKKLDERTIGVEVDEKIFASAEARKAFDTLEVRAACGKPTDETMGEWEGFKDELKQAVEEAKQAAKQRNGK